MPRFLHIADPHIDSPVSDVPGWRQRRGEQSITRTAFAAAVELALDETVDLVVIAGDLFDGDHDDSRTWQWTREQLLKLADSGTPIVFIRGNHDAAGQLTANFNWPGNVVELPVDRAGSHDIDGTPFTVHGQGFAERAVTTNLSSAYPKAAPDRFNIGLLHTCLQNTTHAAYAPASPDDLLRKGYDYWALGHVHQPTAAADYAAHDVPIVFAGNPQGRDVGECGPRGVVLVEADSGGAVPTFHATDSLRWCVESVPAEACSGSADLLDAVIARLRDVKAAAGTRDAAVRLEVFGPFEGHQEIDSVAGKSVFRTDLEDRLQSLDGLHLESLRIATAPPVDLDRLRRENSLLAEVLAEFDAAIATAEAAASEGAGRDGEPVTTDKTTDEQKPDDRTLFPMEATGGLLGETLDTIDQYTGSLAGLRLDVQPSPADQVRWLRTARSHLIAELTAG